jgi:hypothetical protein
VHEIRSWTDLKNRLDSDRRLYAFFHPRMPMEPLIFVEVALTDRSPTTCRRCSTRMRRCSMRAAPTPRSSIRSPTRRPACAACPSATSC